MIAASADNALIMMWVAFTVVALAGVIAVFVWAVRSRQFTNQDQARYLPLHSGIPSDGPPNVKTSENLPASANSKLKLNEKSPDVLP
jgi:nitrogen fixation-related uncharacterized protein